MVLTRTTRRLFIFPPFAISSFINLPFSLVYYCVCLVDNPQIPEINSTVTISIAAHMPTTSYEMGVGDISLSHSDIIALVTGIIGILIAFATLMHTMKCRQRLMKNVTLNETNIGS